MSAHLWWRSGTISKVWRYGLAVISCAVALAVSLPTDAPSSRLTIAVVATATSVRTLADAERAHIVETLRGTNGVLAGKNGAAASY